MIAGRVAITTLQQRHPRRVISWWSGGERDMELQDNSMVGAGVGAMDNTAQQRASAQDEQALQNPLEHTLSAIEKQYAAIPQGIPRRIHILGTGSIGKLVAHALRGLADPPPVTLIFHRYKHLVEWRKGPQTITVNDDGYDVKRSGFEVEVLPQMRMQHGVPYRVDDPTLYSPMSRPHEAAAARTEETGSLASLDRAEWMKDEDDEAFSNEPIHNLILTTKAFASVHAILRIKHRLTPDSTICLLQNGLGVVEELNSKLFPDPAERPNYMQGVVTHGANVPSDVALRDPFYVVHAGHGTMALGLIPRESTSTSSSTAARRTSRNVDDTVKWPSSSRYLIRTLTRSPVLCAVGHTPIELLQLQLEKLAVNSVLNPLTALLDSRNGGILYSFDITRTMRLMLAETSLVLRSLPELRGIANVENRFSASRLETVVVSVANLTKDNISSTLADVRAGRQTELEYINGYIVKRGEEMGIKCVVNYAMMNAVMGKTKLVQNEMHELVPTEGPEH